MGVDSITVIDNRATVKAQEVLDLLKKVETDVVQVKTDVVQIKEDAIKEP